MTASNAAALRGRVTSHPAFGPFVALVVVYLGFYALAPQTLGGAANLVTMALQTVVVAVCAVGMTLVVVQGGIDLSVGSQVALTTVVVAKCLRHGEGAATAAAVGVAVAALTGFANGLLVTRLRLAPFIVTLGTMSALRGVAKGLANETKIDADARGLDAWLMPSAGHVPAGVWLAVAIAVLGAGALTTTRFGRHVFAVGSSEPTARLAGIAVQRVKVIVYSLAGIFAGIAGVLEFSRLTVGDPTDSVGLELKVIASVVIGGGSLAGGQGSVLGAMVGACFMTVIDAGCTHLGLPTWVQEIVTGAVIVIAAALDRVRAKSGAAAQ